MRMHENETHVDDVDIRPLKEMTLGIISRIQAVGLNVCVITGPVTSGGTGNKVTNLHIYDAVVTGVSKRGFRVFDPRPYYPVLDTFYAAWAVAHSGTYPQPILEIFSGWIYECGLVKNAFCIPGKGSVGTAWELARLETFKIPIHYLSNEEIRGLLLTHGYRAERIDELTEHLRTSVS